MAHFSGGKQEHGAQFSPQNKHATFALGGGNNLKSLSLTGNQEVTWSQAHSKKTKAQQQQEGTEAIAEIKMVGNIETTRAFDITGVEDDVNSNGAFLSGINLLGM